MRAEPVARVRVANVASSIWFSSSRSHGWDGFWTMSGIATRREGVVWMAWPAGPARSCRALSNYGFKLRYSNLFTDPPNPARRLGTGFPCALRELFTHASQERFIFACFSRFSGLHSLFFGIVFIVSTLGEVWSTAFFSLASVFLRLVSWKENAWVTLPHPLRASEVSYNTYGGRLVVRLRARWVQRLNGPATPFTLLGS